MFNHMVEDSVGMDAVFHALSHEARRSMLRQAGRQVLRAWRAQRWDRLEDGTLVIIDLPGRRA